MLLARNPKTAVARKDGSEWALPSQSLKAYVPAGVLAAKHAITLLMGPLHELHIVFRKALML